MDCISGSRESTRLKQKVICYQLIVKRNDIYFNIWPGIETNNAEYALKKNNYASR